MYVLDSTILCVQKDTTTDFYSTKRPSITMRNDSDVIEAINCEESYKLCGSNESNYEYTICVKNDTMCPLVNITFTNTTFENGTIAYNVEKSYNTSTYMPLIEVRMSEGLPCIDSSENNNIADKAYNMLFSNDYYTACQTSVDDQLYSELYRQVEGFPTISEYTLFE